MQGLRLLSDRFRLRGELQGLALGKRLCLVNFPAPCCPRYYTNSGRIGAELTKDNLADTVDEANKSLHRVIADLKRDGNPCNSCVHFINACTGRLISPRRTPIENAALVWK